MAQRRFTVNEVLNILEDDSEFQGADIFLSPPNENENSDEDSADEDLGGEVNNLSRNQLLAAASAIVRTVTGKTSLGEDDTSDHDEPSQNNQLSSDGESDTNSLGSTDTDMTIEYEVPEAAIQQRNPDRGRGRHPGNVLYDVVRQRNQHPRGRGRGRGRAMRRGAPVRHWMRQDISVAQVNEFNWNMPAPPFLQRNLEPVELFELFFDDDVCTLIQQNSVNYARQRGNHGFTLLLDEVRLFLAMLLVTGYNILPRRRMYWEQQKDVKNEALCDAMSRNRFEEILRYLHLADNNQLDPMDKMAKIRPLFAMINERCLLYYPGEQDLSVDESMIPYFGRHSCKQFIHGKPIRFGYKLWCLNTRLGYLIQFEPYQGAGTGQHELGLGAGVVLDLIAELPNQHYRLYFDNLFTSIKLLDQLIGLGIGGTGTIRSNRIEKCPLLPPQRITKMERGTYDYRFDSIGRSVVVEWNDNNAVFVGTNCHQVEPPNRVRRWSRKHNRFVDIQQPRVIADYNRNMGGVDRMDQNINNYRISIRTKKWWWPLFAFVPDMVVQNAWVLYKLSNRYQREPLDLLEFRRQICQIYLMRFSQRSAMGRPIGRARALHKRVPDVVRLDGKNHFVVAGLTQRVCAFCGGKSTRRCGKCDVGLHDRCFLAFHQA